MCPFLNVEMFQSTEEATELKIVQLKSNQVAGGEGLDVLQEGLDVLQGGGHRPHLHPPLCHRLHSLHLPGSQRVAEDL